MEIIKDRFEDFEDYKNFYKRIPICEIGDDEIMFAASRKMLKHSMECTSKEKISTLQRLLFINKVVGEQGSILDIGCHTGLLSLPYANLGRRVVGIDISEKAIEFCNKKVKQYDMGYCEYICSPFEEFKTQEEFDFVIVAEVIEHVLEPEKLLELAEKHCFNKVIITTPNYYGIYGIDNKGDTGKEHIRLYKEKELEDIISKRGTITDKEVGDIIMIAYEPNS